MTRGPVLIDLEDKPAPSVAEAPPVPDDLPAPQGQAMQMAARLAARPPSRLARWFWGLAVALLATVISVATWDFVTALVERNLVLGYAVTALVAAFFVVAVAIALREAAAFGRLARLDDLRHAARDARADADLGAARGVVDRIDALYARREDTRWGDLSAEQREHLLPEEFRDYGHSLRLSTARDFQNIPDLEHTKALL